MPNTIAEERQQFEYALSQLAGAKDDFSRKTAEIQTEGVVLGEIAYNGRKVAYNPNLAEIARKLALAGSLGEPFDEALARVEKKLGKVPLPIAARLRKLVD